MRALRIVAIVVLAAAGVTACAKPPPEPPPVTLADLNGFFTGTSTLRAGDCPIRFQTFDAQYEVRNPAKEVRLHIEGCIEPNPPAFFGPGTFTIDTEVGSLLGKASGPVTNDFEYDILLKVKGGTGQFKGNRETAHVFIHWSTQPGGGPIRGAFKAD